MAGTLHIGLSDVALLARVQRAPVSMWLRRYASSDTPFPAPVAVRGVQALYDGDEVVSWLERTGLGKNPEARADLAAFAVLAETSEDDEVVFAGLTALLCLTKYVDRLPLEHDELLDKADAADPDDEFLFAELDALGDRLVPLARYTSLLVDAAYHAGAAFERLMSLRARRSRSGYARTALSAPARRLAASLALALGTDAEIAVPLYVDPAPGASDLLMELAGLAEDTGSFTVATPDGNGPEERLTRRRLRVHDIIRQPLPSDGHGGFAIPDDAVVITQVPSPDRPELSDLELLERVENVVLGSAPERRAVIIGPASALTERLHGRAAAVRDGILRTERLRGVVRLPDGLMPRQPRSRLAMWCLGPVPAEPTTGYEARTMAADLADIHLDDVVIAELVTDLLAGMHDIRGLRAHRPRFTRPVATRTLLARLGGLVEPAPARPREAPVAQLVERIAALSSRLIAPLDPPPTVEPVPRAEPTGLPLTINDAIKRRELRVLPGLRLDPAHLDDTASVRVIGPPELTGDGAVPRAVDRLVLAAEYPASRFTEPGDVVFCTAPRPAALVDIEGGSVVVFPSRILRSRSARLPPRAVAAAVNAQPRSARSWRGWTLWTIPDDQAAGLTAILDGLERHRADLTRRLDAVDQLAAAIMDGTASGVLDLSQHERKDPRATSEEEGGDARRAVDDERAEGHALEGGGQAARVDGRLAVQERGAGAGLPQVRVRRLR